MESLRGDNLAECVWLCRYSKKLVWVELLINVVSCLSFRKGECVWACMSVFVLIQLAKRSFWLILTNKRLFEGQDLVLSLGLV